MVTIRDVMSSFELYQPSNTEDALALLDRLGDDTWVMAGGKDSLNWFKDRIARPKSVVELMSIEEMKGIRETADGIEIGALTTVTERENNPLIQSKYGLLAESARRVASPQIRNAGTIGGNVSQDTRCWYYQDGLPCYRAGGNTCFADTPVGQNREHAIFGADRCVAVTPSDTAPAFVAMEAQMVIRSSKGERVVDAEDFFVGPGVDIKKMTTLKPGEILTHIRVPNTWAGARFYFEKVADRNTWDFALVNIAAVLKVSGGTIQGARIVAGGVEPVPRRIIAAEQLVTGETQSEETAALAGRVSVRGAKPLNFNHFKVPLLESLVKRAVRDAA